MSVGRSSFDESWHRVASLRPRLRTAVHTRRQRFRRRTWHVVTDETNNNYFRLDEGGYTFIALLDGRRTVARAWEICNETLGDGAPTQGEAIRLLGQLFTSNLLRGEIAPDTQQVFDRFRERRNRELRSYLSSFLWLRLPLVDPNPLLQETVRYAGWLFTPIGVALWLALMIAAIYHLIGRGSALAVGFDPQVLLSTENLLLLYLTFAATKVIHEFGHGYSCAHFAKLDGARGEVHKLGVMLMVFVPVPYVDASSSWMIRNKFHRAIVGAAGMYFELALAAIAAIIWARTGDTHPLLRAICYNVMVVAGVSTLLFNANPLLRYDGYYILSDVLEIANLAQRAQQQVWYLVRRYAFGLADLHAAAHTIGESVWLAGYWVCAGIYRILVSFSIILYVFDQFFAIGVLMALACIVMWLVVPVVRFVRYVASNAELQRVRRRAISVSVGVIGSVVAFVGFVPMPERHRAEGVVEPVRLAMIRATVEGQVASVLPSGVGVDPLGPPVVESVSQRVNSDLAECEAAIRIATIRREMERSGDPAKMQAFSEQIAALTERMTRIDRERRELTVQAPFAGLWVSPDGRRLEGAHVKRGETMGMVADLSRLIMRVSTGQRMGPRISSELGVGESAVVEIRVRNRPDMSMRGTISKILPAGQHQLPSAALAARVGGEWSVDSRDDTGLKTTEPFFEVHVHPEAGPNGWDAAGLMRWTGQRVIVRFSMPPQPLAVQWLRWLDQLLQRRKAIPG